jgi:hypothetical protein
MRQQVASLGLGCVRLCHPLDCSSPRMDLGDTDPLGGEDDGVIRSPACAKQPSTGHGVAELHGRSAVERRFLQFVVRPETDPSAVRREERSSCPDGARQGCRLSLIELAPEELADATANSAEHHGSAVRRQREGGAAGTSRCDAAWKVFGRPHVNQQARHEPISGGPWQKRPDAHGPHEH